MFHIVITSAGGKIKGIQANDFIITKTHFKVNAATGTTEGTQCYREIEQSLDSFKQIVVDDEVLWRRVNR